MASVHRREFLKGTAGASVGLTIISATQAKVAPGERLNVAIMGLGFRGRGLARGFAGMGDTQVTHLCEVDDSRIPSMVKAVADKQEGREPRRVKDVRRVLDDPAVDALVVATPEHWHAPATVWACQAGKHVYVEKPASQNVWEGRKMVEAARKYGRIVQVGTQCRSAPHYLEAIEHVRGGKLGRVLMAKAWNSQLRADIGKKPDSDPPPGVDYDLWLGPAPERPFNVNRFHTTWHWHWDYGSGDMGNDGVHDLDIARWGLGVDFPSRVTCAGGKLFFDDDQQIPDTQVVTFTFPGSRAILVYEQRLWSPYVQEEFENGVAFYGTEGYILLGRSGWKLIERGNKPTPTVPRPFSDQPHLRDFVAGIKTGRRPAADIEEGHRSAVLAHLGNIAYRVGRPLTFDASSETIDGDEQAARLLRREYRRPFVVPEQV